MPPTNDSAASSTADSPASQRTKQARDFHAHSAAEHDRRARREQAQRSAASVARLTSPGPVSTLEAEAATRRLLDLISATSCRAHEARSGHPCYAIPTEHDRGDARGFCGSRIALALGTLRAVMREQATQ